jgi:hypothetical protein
MPIHLVKVLQNEKLQTCSDDLVSEIRLPTRKVFPPNDNKRHRGENYLYLLVEISLGSIIVRLRHVHARLRSQENYSKIIKLILNNQQLPDKKLTIK